MKISTYQNDTLVSADDKVIGTDSDNLSVTKNYRIGDILALVSTNTTLVLDARSTAVSQLPDLLGNSLQIEFGAAQLTSTDPVQIAVDGTVTFNEAGQYLINFSAFLSSRVVGPGNATLGIRPILDSNAGITKTFGIINIDGLGYTYETTIPINITTAGSILTWEVVRDSASSNDVGLYENTILGTVSAWDPEPSAALLIWKLA